MAEDDSTVGQLCAGFSSPGATAVQWEAAVRAMEAAEVFWLSSVRPDGRPHVTPLLAIWRDGALFFCTGPGERKAANLGANPSCVLTTGTNRLDGVDMVVEGRAFPVLDPAGRRSVAGALEAKYGAHFEEPDGTWAGLGDAIRSGGVILYQVVPDAVFAFGKGEPYSQTRWAFA